MEDKGLNFNDVQSVGGKDRPRRSRVLKKAHAAFNVEFSAVPCSVRNYSEFGALLEFVDPVLVPERFMLHIEIDGIKSEVERRWQKGKFVGVRFIGSKMHTEVGRDQVVQPSENRLLSAQEREAEMRRKLDEARHAKLMESAPQPEAVQQTEEDAVPVDDRPIMVTTPAPPPIPPEEAPITGRIPVEERRSGLDRRNGGRPAFGRRNSDKRNF